MSEPSPKASAPDESTAREEPQGLHASTVPEKIGSSSRPTKKWCALHYIVAEPPPGFPSSFDLGAAAREEVRQIVKAAESFDRDMYVACQVDFGDRLGMERVIVEGQATKAIHIKSETPDLPGNPVVLTNFFKWVLRELPAERYALFFWGHTFGPASLFSPPLRGRRVLGLPELRHALEPFRNDGRSLDVILFKDCWMSTLETACELRDVVKFVVASQALVPILPAWPYHGLFTDLVRADGDAPTELVTRLGRFYDKPGNRGLDDAVPFALLDLNQTATVSHALAGLVKELRGVEVRDRASAIERASIGDLALADVRTLCDNLQGTSASASAVTPATAARSLDVAVSHLVAQQYVQTPGYRGVSVFYYPSRAKRNESPRDRYIWSLLPFSRYTRFAVARATKWEDVGYEQLNSRSTQP